MTTQKLYEKQAPEHVTTVTAGSTVFGGQSVPIIAGPCSVESSAQLQEIADTLKALGIFCMRGGIFKPRTSPYSFQGLREEGLEILETLRNTTGMTIISEVMSPEQIPVATPYMDCFQVGSRNMQNFELLKALGKQDKPVLLKRGLAATIEEFLNAAEYIMQGGNHQVILCERGIRSFDPMTRNVLDLASVALLKELTHLPVIVDPSHGTGKRSLVAPTSKAALAVGADGLMIEIHPEPEQSVSDADQAFPLKQFPKLVTELKYVAASVGRSIPGRALPVNTSEPEMATIN